MLIFLLSMQLLSHPEKPSAKPQPKQQVEEQEELEDIIFIPIDDEEEYSSDDFS